MYKIEQYKEILGYLQDDLNMLDCKLKSLLFENRSMGQSIDIETFTSNINAFIFAKSKRLRPVVLFLIRDIFILDFKAINTKSAEKILNLIAALELLHSATLIHDDIMDDAIKRRGMETFHIKYNPKIAVIAGDYLLGVCLKTLSMIGYSEIFSYFAQNTLNICNGEIEQFFNKNKAVTIETYLNKSKDKTSSLFMAGAKSLLYLIDKEIVQIKDEMKDKIMEFVLKFSLSFQIYDDIENFKIEFNEEKNTEKQSSDIKNGIYTLPYLYLLQEGGVYGMIDENLHNKYTKPDYTYKMALEFSNKYLNNILDEAIEAIKNLNNTQNLIKLAKIFKSPQG